MVTTKLGQDGKVLRLCTDRGCSFYLRHVENCGACMGFGLWPTSKAPMGATRAALIRASDKNFAEEVFVPWVPCPECGGTPWGIVEEESSWP